VWVLPCGALSTCLPLPALQDQYCFWRAEMRNCFLGIAFTLISTGVSAAPVPLPVPSPSPFSGARILYQWDWSCNAANCLLGGPIIGSAGAPIPQGKSVTIWLVAMPSGPSNPVLTYFVFLPETKAWLMTQVPSDFNFIATHLTLSFAGVRR
jgi:hypothetical protein